jgi:hypothetical protein
MTQASQKGPPFRLEFAVLALALGLVSSALTADFQVTNTVDSGEGSLRWAILSANATAGANTITCTNVSGTITLLSPLPAFVNNIALIGPGADRLTLNVPGIANYATSSLSGLTIQGRVPVPIFAVISNSGALSVDRCEVTGGGTGIYNEGRLAVSHSGIIDNRKTTGCYVEGGCFGGGYMSGAGIYIQSGDTSLTNCTFSGNAAYFVYASIRGGWAYYYGSGGAIFQAGAGPLAIVNCTFKGNYAPTAPSISASPSVLFNNLVADQDSLESIGGTGTNLIGSYLSTGLGPLQNNGGPTRTHALLPGSPAIDSGSGEGAPTVDQRGFLRPFGRAVDIGAFEYGAVPLYRLVIVTEENSTRSGSVTISPASTHYVSNTLVTLTALPVPGWTFLQWLGDASGTSAVTHVRIMNRDLYAQALFGTTLNTMVAGNGSVVVDPVAALYPFGRVIQLTAVPQEGNYFGAWDNPALSTNNPLLFTVTNANPTVSCAFGPLNAGEVALTVLVNGHGRVATNPRGNRFTSGQSVTLTANADAEQQFLGWSGDASGTSTNMSVVLAQSKVITANFTKHPRLSLGPCLGGWREDGFQLTLTGEMGGRYRIERSNGLENWATLANITNAFGIWQISDTTVTNDKMRFYRAIEVP